MKAGYTEKELSDKRSFTVEVCFFLFMLNEQDGRGI